MVKTIIRKNIVTNNWEHYVSQKNSISSHWAPGFLGNDVINNKEQVISTINRDADNYIVIYEDVNYEKIEYTLTPLNFSTLNTAITELITV